MPRAFDLDFRAGVFNGNAAGGGWFSCGGGRNSRPPLFYKFRSGDSYVDTSNGPACTVLDHSSRSPDITLSAICAITASPSGPRTDHGVLTESFLRSRGALPLPSRRDPVAVSIGLRKHHGRRDQRDCGGGQTPPIPGETKTCSMASAGSGRECRNE